MLTKDDINYNATGGKSSQTERQNHRKICGGRCAIRFPATNRWRGRTEVDAVVTEIHGGQTATLLADSRSRRRFGLSMESDRLLTLPMTSFELFIAI